ncbi:MAG: TIM barrel protein [Planctomycetota bacterium]
MINQSNQNSDFEKCLTYCVFSKHLVGPPLDEVAARLAKMGICAIDLTCRPNGHVLPEKVADDLPRAVELLKKGGVSVAMLTTNITEATPANAKVLQTAAKLGVRYYKLGYYYYAGFNTIKQQRAEVAAKLKDLAALNLEIGIHGGFHNHSEDSFGAVMADIHAVIQDIPKKAIGVYFDPTHAVIEGGSAGWLMGLDLLADHITMLSVKDFCWVEGKHRYAGARRHSIEFTTLEKGNTPWPTVLQHLKAIKFNGPVSFHSEYQGDYSFKNLSVDEVFEQTERDFKQFRSWLP